MVVIDGVEMVDVREAAQLARRTPETVRRWVWTGRLTATKQGNRLLVARADVTSLAAPAGPSDAAGVRALSLAEWAATVRKDRVGSPGVTAADLVWDDRAGR
jgi:excisionase family DNA binding protein